MFFEVLSSVLGNAWRFFTDVNIPSTDIPFSAFLLATMLIRFSIWLFGFVTGGGIRGASYGKSSNARRKQMTAGEKRFAQDASNRTSYTQL